jgi:hypothetical protein
MIDNLRLLHGEWFTDSACGGGLCVLGGGGKSRGSTLATFWPSNGSVCLMDLTWINQALKQLG